MKKLKNMKKFDGDYNSTNDFVATNNLEKLANKLFGKGWEAEDDCEQISELIEEETNNSRFYVIKVDDNKNEDDIIVEFSQDLEDLEKARIRNARAVEHAKEILKDNGFFVDNLWHIDDVKSKFDCTDEDAQEVLNSALTNDATMEQIWYAIGFHGEDEKLEPIEE